MPAGPASSLWTPEGMVPLAQKGIVPISRQEIILLSKLHEFAQTHGVMLVCQRCDGSIGGSNNGTGTTLSVACKCREFRFSGA